MIRLDTQCGGHHPQLMASVQLNSSKEILVVSLLVEILGEVTHGVAATCWFLWCGPEAFSKPVSCVNVDNFSLEKKPYSKVLVPVIS